MFRLVDIALQYICVGLTVFPCTLTCCVTDIHIHVGVTDIHTVHVELQTLHVVHVELHDIHHKYTELSAQIMT